MDELPVILTPRQLAELLATTEASLAQDRYLGRGVPYTKVGARVRYLRDDVLSFLAANRRGGTSAVATLRGA
ncbi:MAG: hypothetical protein QG597_1894 [Actinomycetota bacterium]|nr:hypothetical protein [Actinomycetota bacterium]